MIFDNSIRHKCLILAIFQLNNSNKIINLLFDKKINLNTKSFFTPEKELYSGEYLVNQVNKIFNFNY